jgi:hypothetical protein
MTSLLDGIIGVFLFSARQQALAAFPSSSAFLLGLMAATMAGNYPYWSRSTIDVAHSLMATNTAPDSHALQVGIA